MKKLAFILLAIMAVVSCADLIPSFCNIDGTVYDSKTGVPLKDVSVAIEILNYSQVTSSDGTFRFENLEEDEYTLVFVRSGYETVEHTIAVKPKNVYSLQIKMSPVSTGVPEVTMEAVSEVTASGAKASGNLQDIGDSEVSQYGFCWSSTNEYPTLSDNCCNLGEATGVMSFTAKISGLSPLTKYYIRSYAVNSVGTSYSAEVISFTTEDVSSSLAVPHALVSFYTFDGEDASDDAGYELDGVLIGEPSFVTETVTGHGKALSLDGTKGQFMSIPYNVFMNVPKLSVSFWIKDFSTGVIFSAISEDYVRSDHPRLLADADGKFRFYTGYDNYDATSSFAYLYTPIKSGEWHHVAVTMDGDARVLYVDGTRVDANSASSDTNRWPSDKIYIGGDNDGKYTSGAMTMKIDNIRFYQRCITSAEVKEIYNSEK